MLALTALRGAPPEPALLPPTPPAHSPPLPAVPPEPVGPPPAACEAPPLLPPPTPGVLSPPAPERDPPVFGLPEMPAPPVATPCAPPLAALSRGVLELQASERESAHHVTSRVGNREMSTAGAGEGWSLRNCRGALSAGLCVCPSLLECLTHRDVDAAGVADSLGEFEAHDRFLLLAQRTAESPADHRVVSIFAFPIREVIEQGGDACEG